jgi:hypothetical protein
MYCPRCAHPVNKDLKYCNSCGGRLKRDDDKGGPAKMLDEVLDTLFWTSILGLGILIGLVAVLLNRSVQADVLGLIVVAYLAALFGICFMLARQVPKLIDAKLKSSASSETSAMPQLRSVNTNQLTERREPAASVTDHTTRTLDDIPVRHS